jgi:hypothetical protein
VALAGIVTAGVLLLRPDPVKPGKVDGAEPGERHASDSYYVIPGIEPRERPPVLGETETGEMDSETGETVVAETGESEDDGRTTGPSRPNNEVECLVTVTDLPAALLDGGDYALSVPGQGRKPLPANGSLSIPVSDKVKVQLTGVAYTGSLVLDPQKCSRGDVQTLQATPKPAKLNFQAGAIPLSKLIVSCVKGCSLEKRFANSFPALMFPRGETEMIVELEFKATNYRSDTKEFKLTPGNNPIQITLDPLGE